MCCAYIYVCLCERHWISGIDGNIKIIFIHARGDVILRALSKETFCKTLSKNYILKTTVQDNCAEKKSVPQKVTKRVESDHFGPK